MDNRLVAEADRFSAYGFRLPQETVHALSNAQLLRNLHKIVELDKQSEG